MTDQEFRQYVIAQCNEMLIKAHETSRSTPGTSVPSVVARPAPTVQPAQPGDEIVDTIDRGATGALRVAGSVAQWAAIVAQIKSGGLIRQ